MVILLGCEALVLRELAGLEHSAIARRLSVSPENSRFLVAAARRTLRDRRAQRDLDHPNTQALKEAA
jgi:DNA-directed RNA polymerase specialized sigma24 family protein